MRWDVLRSNPEDFERLVKLILARRFNELELVQHGRPQPFDAKQETPDGPIFFEIKAFTKLGPSQRRQIEMLFRRLESLNPYRVVVVAPIGLTPAALAWLEYVGSEYQFEVQWLGADWLDQQLDTFPEIGTYFGLSIADRAKSLIGAVLSNSRVIDNVSDARDALVAGKFDRLLGARECLWLDVKEGPYRIDDNSSAAELLKDVAAFANSEGGLLVVGYRTQLDGKCEVISEIRPVPRKLVDTDRYRKFVRKNLAPHVRGLKISWHDTGDAKGILVIDIPMQAEFNKPFVAPGPDGPKSFPSVGVPIRDADATDWLARSDLQRLLSGGWNMGRGDTVGPSAEVEL